ncbi:MAG TPA: sulfite exporter TauE/SafE family protein [Streptosporangiaceae bacterium]
MLSGAWIEVVALVAAFAIAVITTPAGVSGAVLLLPFQVSVLGTPSPSVTPTNLLYNVVACPGAMWRYWRQGQTGGTLTWLLLAGTLPGVVAGSVIRVYVLPGPVVFDFVVAAVLIPLGTWLALAPVNHATTTGRARLPRMVTGLLAAVAGCVGGIYGIGGGSILAPILIADGQPASQVAPAALSSTFVTSLGGVVTFSLLSINHQGSIAPDWPTGIALGIGGLAGGYVGARMHARMPETLIRRLLALVVVAIGIRFLVAGLTGGT